MGTMNIQWEIASDIMSKELEDRFCEFARRVGAFCKQIKWDVINVEYVRQLIKSSGSVAAN